MRDRSAFVPCIPVRSIGRHSTHTLRTSIGTKALRSLVRDEFYWVASAAASAALRDLPRYLPWLCRDALHPSAPDATRVARLNQRFPSSWWVRAALSCRYGLPPMTPCHPCLRRWRRSLGYARHRRGFLMVQRATFRRLFLFGPTM